MLRRPVLFTIIALICVLLTACQADFGIEQLGMQMAGTSESDTGGADYDIMDRGPVGGGVLKLFTTTPDTLNPVLTKNIYVADFLDFIYESLVALDQNGRPVPALSDSWSVSTDGLVWDFHIRSGVQWQDGQTLTAADVQYTFDFILNGRTDSVYKRQLQNVATYTAEDESSFKMVLRKPNSFTPETMTFPVLPAHIQAERDPAADSNFRPVGTGPFRFGSYEKDKRVVLEANEDWWYLKSHPDGAEDMMYLKEIDVSIYNSSDDAINAFQTGDTDAVCVNSADFNKYNGRTDLLIKKYVSRDFDFLAFNLYNPIFADVYVRKAVDAAINRNSIVRDAFRGDALAADLPVSPESWLFSDMQKPDSMEAAPVDELLKQGGWKEKTNAPSNNGSRYYKSINGVRKDLNIEILVNSSNSSRVSVADMICSQLKSKGIAAKVVLLGWEEMLARIDARKFDVALLGCRTTQVPDISFLYSNSYLPAYQSLRGDVGRNVSGYSNPEVNSYIEKIFAEQSDTVKKAMFFNMKQLIEEDVPYIGLYFTENAVIYRKNVRGLLNPYVWNKYNDVTRWYKPDLQ